MSKTKPPSKINTRLVLNFPGFEQTDSAAQLGRLNYCLEQSGKVWAYNTNQHITPPAEGVHHTIADHETKGANWSSNTRLVQFRWNDIVEAYEKSPFPMGFLKNSFKFFAFFTDGTVLRYLKTSPRYFGFTIFPILLMIIFAALMWNLIGLFTINFWIKLIATLIGTLLLCKWPGNKLYVPLTIADWGFARDMINRENQEVENRFSEFAQTCVTEISASDHDEIVIVGHSFGAIWAIAAIAQALEKEPDLLKGKTVTFLALGSSILKLALSPKAKSIKQYWNSITENKNIFWHEVQTKDDWIAFYKCDPFELEEFSAPSAGYTIDRIKFKDGMERKRYKSMKRSFYRTHRQYILSYDTRTHIDYMLRLVGPFAAQSLANDKTLHQRIDQSGKLV